MNSITQKQWSFTMYDSDDKKKVGIGYVLDLAYSHCKSKVLFVSTELGIYSILSHTKKSPQEVAQELGLEQRPAEMLLNACVSLGLLEKKDGFYTNTYTAETFLVKEKPMYVGNAFQVFDKRNYKVWDKLNEAVKTNKPQAYSNGDGDLFEEMVKDKEDMHCFFQGLHSLAYWPANSLPRIFDFNPYHHLLDVGGGSGVYSIAIVKRYMHLHATILDLPPVCKIANEYITKEKLSHKITTFPGDFFNEEFPRGVDVVLFSNLLHDWEEKKVEYLLNKTFRSLPSKGGVIISDLILTNDGTKPLYATLMSLTLLLGTKRGSNYTEEQYKCWLEKTGFREINIKPISGPNRIVTAIKP
jgi:3-hydroxy-5-methyl-1-naphthoate 3-O-methyltransferase